MKQFNETGRGLMKQIMKQAVFCAVFWASWSFGFSCPEASDLTDLTARQRCLNNVLTHWQVEIEKRIIKKWQHAYKKDGLAGAGKYTIYISQEQNLDRLVRIKKLIDPLQNLGVYQPVPTTLTCSNSD